jgi:hypothetical protein
MNWMIETPSSQINRYQKSNNLETPKFCGKITCYTQYKIMGNFALRCALHLCLIVSLPR